MRKDKREKIEKIENPEEIEKVENQEKKEKVKKSKERRFPKFHLLDAVIIILVLAIIAGIYFRYNVFDSLGNLKNQSEAHITFSVNDIRDTTELYVQIDDAVYFKSDGKPLGTIMGSSENSSRPLTINLATKDFYENGEVISVNYPSDTRINAEGRIKAKGVFGKDGSFMLNGSTYLSAGQKYVVCTEKVTLEITITGIEEP